MEAVECGAASLGIVLGYFGRTVPLEELRVVCGVSRDGSKASNVVRAARHYGLEAEGFKVEVERLSQIELPAILFWNFNHFLVLEGFGTRGFFVNDPASGPRTVSAEEFDAAFTGIAITMKPGPEFRRGGHRPSLWRSLGQRARGSETAFLFALVAGMAMVVPGLILPTFSQVFVDRFLIANAETWYRPLLVGLTLTALTRATLVWLQQRYLLRLETKIAVTTSSRFLWHILRLPIEFYTQRYGGEISSRVEMNDAVAVFLCSRLAAAAIDALLVIFFVLLMLSYDPTLAGLGIVAAIVIILVTVAVNRRRIDGNRRLLQERGKAIGTLMGGLQTIETLKASGGETDLFARWAGYHAKFINAYQELGTVTQLFLAVPPLMVGLANASVLALGGYRVMQGQMTIGMLVAFQTLMASFLRPVSNLVSLASNVQETEGQMNRIDDVLRYQTDPQVDRTVEQVGGEEASRKLAGFLELRHVTFGYSRLDAPLIEGFSLKLAPGQRVALVGPSGCGKSTIAKLVTGLYQPWEGTVLFDETPTADVPRNILTNSVAVVDQDVTLFEGTVRENLSLWDSTAPEAVLVEACKDACIHDDLVARQGGYDGRIEEGGINFSGGQRQRLEIGRALVGNPRIIVLDEATSALDTVTEQIVDRNLRIRGCTCLIIAHRLSTIRDADEIIVLDRGKVVQRGRHGQLMADPDGLYARLAREG
jgi:NHLM bacteriocin system ABC transporter peptidase/ATP-binding protein